MVKKAQTFLTDLTISLIIFSTFLIIAFNKWNTELNELNELRKTEDLWFETEQLMKTLTYSQGNPENWTLINLKNVGLMSTPNHLDNYKVEYFINLSKNNYQDLKKKIGFNNYDFNLKIDYANGTNIYDQGNSFYDASEVFRIKKSAYLDKKEFPLKYDEVIVELISWRSD